MDKTLKYNNFFILASALVILAIAFSPRFPLANIPGRTVELRVEDILLFFFVLIWVLILSLRPRIYLTPLFKPIAVYLAIVFFTTIIALFFQKTVFSRALFYTLKEIEFFVIFLFIANCIRDKEALKKIYYVLLFAGIMSVCWALFQVVTNQGHQLFLIAPLEGVSQHKALLARYGISLIGETSPLTVAGFFALMSFLAYSYLFFYQGSLKKKLFFLGMGMLFTACSIYSGEKIAIVFFAVGIITLVFLDKRKIKLFFIICLFALVLIMLLQSFVILEGSKYGDVTRAFHWKSYIGGLSERIEYCKNYIQYGSGQFLTGFGKGGQHQIFEEAHNHYVKVFLESGIFGLMAFLWLLASVSIMSYRVFRNSKFLISKVISSATLCALAGMSVAALVQDAFKPVLLNEIFWVFVGLTAATYRIERVGKLRNCETV
ncbi:MAG: hypothetical protein JRD93_01635 [Deltaproteobacteria bacterium]|nr:hypothetical protein [Deltaproteobacteria bacterium]